MTHQTDTLIIGGGIIGLSVAWELARRGTHVTLIEASQCAQAASWAGVGILPPTARRQVLEPLEQLRTLSHDLLAEWSDALRLQTGIDTGYRRCGGVYLATTFGEAATLAANLAYWDDLGIEAQPLDAQALCQDQPALCGLAGSGRIQACVYLPGECQLRTPHYTRALLQACQQAGVEIVCQSALSQLTVTSGLVTQAIVQERGTVSSYRANHYCLTSGAWTGGLLQSLGINSGIIPIRGQVILYRTDRPLLTRIINEGHRYLVPRDDGRILVGSNEEEVGFVCETTDDILSQLHAWAVGIVPELHTATIEKSWAGLRPGSYDSYPYIGRMAGIENLLVAAGHFRAGIHLSAGTARVLADLIITGQSNIDLASFRPGRG